MIFLKVRLLKNCNEIEQNFANSKNLYEWKNILKIQKLFVTYKIVYSFIKCSLIQNMITHFEKNLVKSKGQCSSISKIVTPIVCCFGCPFLGQRLETPLCVAKKTTFAYPKFYSTHTLVP